MNLDNIFDTIDKMRQKKRHKGPSEDYFPTAAEINTYGRSEDIVAIVPYLIYLEDSLSPAGAEIHKEAVKALHKLVADLQKEGKLV